MSETGFADLGDTRFYYEMAGAGPFLVLIHAGICDLRMWDEQFQHFAERYRVLRYDRRGFGKTQAGPGPFSHHRDLHELLKRFNIEEAILVGCSQGGKAALDLALEHPRMVKALVLVSSAVSGFKYSGALPRQFEELGVAV